jgi:hypothetical protein
VYSIVNTSNWHHEPEEFDCPFCQNIATGRGDFPVDILHRFDDVVVKMNPELEATVVEIRTLIVCG